MRARFFRLEDLPHRHVPGQHLLQQDSLSLLEGKSRVLGWRSSCKHSRESLPHQSSTAAIPYPAARYRTLASVPGCVSLSVAKSPCLHHEPFTLIGHKRVKTTPNIVVIHCLPAHPAPKILNAQSAMRVQHRLRQVVAQRQPAPTITTVQNGPSSGRVRGALPRCPSGIPPPSRARALIET